MAVAVLWGCTAGNRKTAEHHEVQLTDSRYTEQKAMAVYDYQPERALQIIDSAKVVGNLSAFRADRLRMRIFGQTQKGDVADSLVAVRADVPLKHNMRYESVIYIGERLLESDSAKTSLAQQENVLEMMLNAARQLGQTEQAIMFARQLVDVCHQQGAETEALRNEAEIGALLCAQGQKEQGFSKLDSVLALLDGQRKFNELDALIIASKRKMDVLAGEGRYLETLPLAQRIIDRLDDYELHPEAYHDGTYREPQDAADRTDYIQFYRSQAQGRMTAAYALLGQQQSLEEVYQQIEHTVRDATAREHLSRYHALEQEMLRNEAESRGRLMTLVSVVSVSALLIVLAFASFVMFQRRSIMRKNRALTQFIAQQQAALQPQPSRPDLSSEQLHQIEERIRTERLYQNPNLSRDDICQTFNIRRDVLNQLINEHSEATSVSTLINSIRLQEACRLLTADPNMTVNAIAEQVGLTPRNLRRLFQDQYGITPTEYRRSSK